MCNTEKEGGSYAKSGKFTDCILWATLKLFLKALYITFLLSLYTCNGKVECGKTGLFVLHAPCRWLPALQNIFFLGNKRKQIPLDHLEAFFDGIAVVMTNQLREMTLASIADYLHVFCPVKVRKHLRRTVQCSPVVLMPVCRKRSVRGYSRGSRSTLSLVALFSSLSPIQVDLR